MSETSKQTSTETAPDWIAGLDETLRAEVTSSGWKTPADVLADHVKLRAALGTDKLPLPPAGADGKRDFSKWDGWAQLGRPEQPDAYAFPSPEGYEFSATDKAFHAAMRPALHASGLAQWQVDQISNAYTAYSQQLLQQAEKAAAAAREELQREWGAAFPQQIDLANRAVRAIFGDAVAEAKQVRLADGRFLLDDPALARAMAKAGALMQEDGSLPAGSAGGGGILTPDAANAEIQRIRGEAMSNPQHPLNNKDHPEHEAIYRRLGQLYQLRDAKKA